MSSSRRLHSNKVGLAQNCKGGAGGKEEHDRLAGNDATAISRGRHDGVRAEIQERLRRRKSIRIFLIMEWEDARGKVLDWQFFA